MHQHFGCLLLACIVRKVRTMKHANVEIGRCARLFTLDRYCYFIHGPDMLTAQEPFSNCLWQGRDSFARSPGFRPSRYLVFNRTRTELIPALNVSSSNRSIRKELGESRALVHTQFGTVTISNVLTESWEVPTFSFYRSHFSHRHVRSWALHTAYLFPSVLSFLPRLFLFDTAVQT
ncbi:hypothetical protein C8Q75DRAFT_75996 [Abortiporus biennis]|nr:hypothetical protein C8Q75DRAFT_75996 [Abortiporus biennis]